MYCINCGSKIEEDAYVCDECGFVIKKRSEIIKKREVKSFGIVSTILGIIAFISSLLLFFHDISSVGMYTEILERILFALNYSLFSILISLGSLIFSLVGKKNIYNNIGLVMSLLSLFFIISEFVVVVVY